MQSIRGLRRAISSRSHALLCSSSRSFTSSTWCKIKQPPPTSNAERVDALRETTKTQLKETAAENKAANSREDVEATLCSSVTAAMARLPHPVVVITTLDRTYHAQATAGVPIEAMRHPIARGITASSFTSLCIRPQPHIMFNMTLPSTMYEALVACKDFNVHFLTPDKHGARIASVFTRGNRLPSLPVGASQNSTCAFDIDADLGVFVGLKDKGLHDVEIGNRGLWHDQYQNAKEIGLRGSGSPQDVDPIAQHGEITESKGQVHHVPRLQSKGIMEVLHCRLARTIHAELPNAGQNVVMIGKVTDVTYPKQLQEKLDRASIALGYADRNYRSIGKAIHPSEPDDLETEPWPSRVTKFTH